MEINPVVLPVQRAGAGRTPAGDAPRRPHAPSF